MRTDELITMLATSSGAVDSSSASKRVGMAIGWGAFGAALLMAVMLGVRPDLGQAVSRPMFWVKIAYAITLLLASLFAVSRLSRPGLTLSGIAPVLLAPVIAMWILGAVELAGADPAERYRLWMGRTWRSCPELIAILSVPAFVAMLWAVRGLAPTRLRLAGAALGLVASSIGAVVYSFHCPEMSAPFLGCWYLLGMLIPPAVGATLGPWLLRW